MLWSIAGCVSPYGSSENWPALPDQVLRDNSCQLPCWNGIIPGTTLALEATEILKTLDFVNAESVTFHEATEPNQWINWSFKGQPPVDNGVIRLADGVVSMIQLAGNFGMTLRQIVDTYGAPDHFSADEPGAEIYAIEYDLFYPTRGVLVEAVRYGTYVPGPPVYSDARLWRVSIYKGGTLEDLVQQMVEEHDESKRPMLIVEWFKAVRPWHGFDPLPTSSAPS